MQDLTAYLSATSILNHTHPHPTIQPLASQLAKNLEGDEQLAKACLEWVRDNIEHHRF